MLVGPKKAVLLDFDGVVLKKSPGHRIITQRCESFVNKFVRCNDRESVENLNKHLYRTSGHTLLGLRKLGYDISIEEFNHHVYTSDICNKVVPSEADKAELQEFCDEYVKRLHGNEEGVGGETQCSLYISSNAPDIWCKTILEKMDVDVDLFQMVGSSDVQYLKPQPEYYAGVHEKIKADHYAFVDDSRINLMPLVDSQQWSPYLCNAYAGSCAGGRITYNVLHTINYLPNLLDVIF